MTKSEGMTKFECRNQRLHHSAHFDIRASDFFRHSSFNDLRSSPRRRASRYRASCRIARTGKYFHFVSLSGCCKRLKSFPMRTRFLLGPAGSGKTCRCLAEIGAELKASPEGLPLVLLVPKQATFQLERQLLARPDLPGYTRLQILSFERLAEFVLAEMCSSVVTAATDR